MVVERRDDRVFPSTQNPDLAHPNPSKRNMPRSTDWVGSDPEMKRKKRVAKYKMLSVEAKVKNTVRSSCRWIKTKFMEVRYGWYA
ncbi:hypothetical protein M758_2G002400 [Ceratodon purpureus]|uniref:Uncharacterized protein n=1 Tax=Ceratodon purpureus TaxID=3225 RepID=A0A8T0ISC7_CERPU|nr:hypothetical protein KC19_2G002400 [Ceratodon purpureus]KAG0624766.1 hypothetical protein M758_2G002400 [Ceratodon purpureus]